ncbi:Uncharacterized membrane protein YckC, RDD family [Rhizobiales bacterium GAS188]|jgi:uncharacterized RDD family membrane protein YckC|nr:Uncharacterized membrane protein YckC, RDD family [Rhizobiales bacterium GAS188]
MQASVPEFPRRAADMPPGWSARSSAFDLAPASLTQRVCAYLVDLLVIGSLILALTLALLALALLTFGASLLLIWPVCAATPVIYSGLTLSGPAQATWGMRVLGLHLRPVEGGRIDFLTGAAHALLFYIFGATMTPFILLIGLFRHDRALLHDLALRVRLVSAG